MNIPDLLLASELDDEDAVAFLMLHSSEPRDRNNRIDLNKMNDEECVNLTRFHRQDLTRLANALHLPDKFRGSNGTTCSGIDGLTITLRRMAYPSRYEDLVPIFGRLPSELSTIFNTVVDFLHARHGHLLQDLNQPWLDAAHLQTYADVIHRSGVPLTHCVGFIDGTVRKICRPQNNQRLVFNGHKRFHALKYQSITIPNGLVANMFGPVEGTR